MRQQITIRFFAGNTRFNAQQVLRKGPPKTSYYMRTFSQVLVSKCVTSVCSKMKQSGKFSRRSYRFGASGPD
jgi:hypothetical protein